MINKKEIKIGKEGFTIKSHSYRAMFEYEEMTGKGVSEISTFKDNITYMFCLLKACNENFNYSFDEFVDKLEDDNTILTNIQESMSKKK